MNWSSLSTHTDDDVYGISSREPHGLLLFTKRYGSLKLLVKFFQNGFNVAA